MISWIGIRDCLIKGEKGLRGNGIRYTLGDFIHKNICYLWTVILFDCVNVCQGFLE